MKIIKVVLLVLVGAISVALASDNFGELNIKAGLNLTSVKRMYFLKENIVNAEKLNPCISFCEEYLIPAEKLVSNLTFLKVGLGIKYLFPSEFKIKNVNPLNIKLSFLPIYFALQVNPFIKLDNEVLRRMFIKGDLGYNAYFSPNTKHVPYNDTERVDFQKSKGGLYYAFGAGYETYLGLIFEVTYSIYKSSTETLVKDIGTGATLYKNKSDFSYSCVGLNVGYKFKI